MHGLFPAFSFLPADGSFSSLRSKKTIEAFGELASIWAVKQKVLPALIESGIPYTLIWSNGFAGYALPGLGGLGPQVTDEVTVFGSGDVKGERSLTLLQTNAKTRETKVLYLLCCQVLFIEASAAYSLARRHIVDWMRP